MLRGVLLSPTTEVARIPTGKIYILNIRVSLSSPKIELLVTQTSRWCENKQRPEGVLPTQVDSPSGHGRTVDLDEKKWHGDRRY